MLCYIGRQEGQPGSVQSVPRVEGGEGVPKARLSLMRVCAMDAMNLRWLRAPVCCVCDAGSAPLTWPALAPSSAAHLRQPLHYMRLQPGSAEWRRILTVCKLKQRGVMPTLHLRTQPTRGPACCQSLHTDTMQISSSSSKRCAAPATRRAAFTPRVVSCRAAQHQAPVAVEAVDAATVISRRGLLVGSAAGAALAANPGASFAVDEGYELFLGYATPPTSYGELMLPSISQ